MRQAQSLKPGGGWSHVQGPQFQGDDRAASPLVVLTTFVLVAVAVTVLVYAVLVDKPEPALGLTAAEEEGRLAFDVTRTNGELAWSDLEVRFIDRAGVDVAGTFLQLPTGSVDEQDRIAVSPAPPAGTYLLQVFVEGQELVRLAVSV